MLFFLFFYSLPFWNVINTYLLCYSIKVLFSLNNMSSESKINNLLNLNKFWVFSHIVKTIMSYVYYFVDNYYFIQLINLLILFFFIDGSYEWMMDNKLNFQYNKDLNFTTSGCIKLIDNIINISMKFYHINRVIVDYIFNKMSNLFESYYLFIMKIIIKIKNIFNKKPKDIPMNEPDEPDMTVIEPDNNNDDEDMSDNSSNKTLDGENVVNNIDELDD